MSSPSQHVRVLVLKKTKLGEADLILTLLGEDGAALRAVAKGARKPKNTFSSRLELYAESDILLVKGRTLDIIAEARLLCAHEALRENLVRSSVASCATELMAVLAQENLPNEKLYPVLNAFLTCAEQAEEDILALELAAFFLKALTFCGLRPGLRDCLFCGSACYSPKEALASPDGHASRVNYSFTDGGPICSSCPCAGNTVLVDAHVLALLDALLHATFAQIATWHPSAHDCAEALSFCDAFIQTHTGTRLKSLTFLMNSALPLVFPC